MPKAYTKVDVNSALALKADHKLSYRQIGKIQGTSHQAIHRALKPFMPTQETEQFIANRAGIYAHVCMKLVKQLDGKRLKSASANNLAYAHGQFHHAEMLEKGLSPESISMEDKLKRAETILNQINININVNGNDSMTSALPSRVVSCVPAYDVQQVEPERAGALVSTDPLPGVD